MSGLVREWVSEGVTTVCPSECVSEYECTCGLVREWVCV